MTALPFAAEVAAYLADCAACRPPLDPRYHPTEDGAVKMIPHRRHADRKADKADEEQIRAAFRAAAERPARQKSGTSGTSGTRAGQTAVSGFRTPAGVPEPPEPSLFSRQEEPLMDAPLERRIAAPVVPVGVGGAGRHPSLGRGGVGEPRAAQLIDDRPSLAVDDGVRPPVKLNAVEPAGTDHPVVVHQRDTGFLRHGHDASAPAGKEELRDAALWCAARGWHVFPVTPAAKKPPAFPAHKAERCDGTDPRCRDGHQGWEPRATTDPGRITRAWARAPYNVGIATGPSGLIVIDLDVPKPGEVPPPQWAAPGICDGADVLAALAEEHGQTFPSETFMVRTRRGGWHLYFAAPPGVRLGNTSGRNPNGLGWLIDTRGHGGYVVAPGSIVATPGGTGRYEVAYDRPPAPLPGWLTALLTAPRPGSPPLECRSLGDGQVGDLDQYAASALKGEVARVTAAVEGGRNAALNKAAYNMGRLIAAGALDDDGTAERVLYAAASAQFGIGDPPFTAADATATIRSAIAAGKRRPRPITTPRGAAA